MTPLVSILIPCYNASPWLAATLESALAQTHPRCEIIVVDDGSQDDSLAIARAHAALHPTITVVAQPNRGACAARNHARRLAQGFFLQYLDADDLLLPDKISRQMALLASAAGADHVVSGEWARFHSAPANAYIKRDALWSDHDAVTWQTLALAGNLMMHPAAWLVPRALSEAAGEWNESLTLNDDGEYFARVRFASGTVRFCAGARSLYRSGLPGSLSSPHSRRAIDSAFRSQQLIQTLLLRHEDSPRTRQACADAWMHLAFSAAAAPDLRDRAAQESNALGGSRLRPGGGRAFRFVCRLFGWRRALQWRRQRMPSLRS